MAWKVRVTRMDDSRDTYAPLCGILILKVLMSYQSLFGVKICTVNRSMNLFVRSLSQIWMQVSACNHVTRLVIKLPFVMCNTTACEQALQVQWTQLLVWSMIQSSQMLVTCDILQWCEPRGLQFTNLWKYMFKITRPVTLKQIEIEEKGASCKRKNFL